jgi:hypothetical protein
VPRETPSVALAAGDGSLQYMPTEDGATLDPWPFAASEVRVGCEGRRLEGRYDDEPSMHAALEAAPLLRLEYRLTGTAGRASP